MPARRRESPAESEIKENALGVQSRHLMDWIERESFGLFCPAFADEVVRREAAKRLEATAEIVRGDEVAEMDLELVVIVRVEALDGRFLDGSVHSLDLPIRPGMLHLGQSMLDAVLPA